MEQRTDEWRLARLGKVGASRIADVAARTKSGWGASRANYAAELLLERITGNPTECYVSQAMQFGTENEPKARAAYSFYADIDVVEVGFIEHPSIAMSGASPDGLVSDDGLVEIKVPLPATHLNTLLTKSIDDRYVKQMYWQMACTGRYWCDFVSFHPAFPENMQLFVKRLPRDDNAIAELEALVSAFLGELKAKVALLTAEYERAAA